ncbi:hypothetical protein H8959_020364, partial [Pygathrix nigripes]
MKTLIAALLLITLQDSWAVSPTDCSAIEPEAEKAVDLINKRRWDGYLFQLLRVADAHLDKVDKVENATVYYLTLDVQESDCLVLSRKHWNDCEPPDSRRPFEIVIGQCKVIATGHSHESQDLRVIDFNCTTSSVSSALANTKDSPVLLDFFEDTESYRKQADKALEKYKEEKDDFASFRVDRIERVARERGEEGTSYFVDFSVRNCSRHYFPRHPNVFGFCRADLFYDVEALDLESPKDLVINCEVFDPQEHGNINGVPPHLRHPFHWGGHEHSSTTTKSPLKPHGSRDHHHPHEPHEHGRPPPPDERDHLHGPPLPQGTPPLLPMPCSRCHHATFGTNGAQIHPHNNNSSDLHPHKHHSHEHHPHGHHPHAHHPHEHGTHRQHPHGHHPHGHHPHGHPPPGHHPHGHHPHGHPPPGHHPHRHHPHGPHPHCHDFQDYGPCDPPPHNQCHHCHGHGPPPGHLRRRGPGKGHRPFHCRQTGSVYRLPSLRK